MSIQRPHSMNYVSQTQPTSFSFGKVRIGHKDEFCSPVTQKTQNSRHYEFLSVRVKAGLAFHLHWARCEPSVQMYFSELAAPWRGQVSYCLSTAWGTAPKGMREGAGQAQQDPAKNRASFSTSLI